MTDREKKIEEMRSNPIFQLSLASKELFHSNFLYWLSLYDREKFKVLIGRLTDTDVEHIDWPSDWQAFREDKKLDLSVSGLIEIVKSTRSNVVNKKCYFFVLENKVKSIATMKQLDDYNNVVLKNNKKYPGKECRFCLLSLSQDFNSKDMIVKKGWKVKSYKDLADYLDEIYLKDVTHKDELYLIKQYRQYIDLLSDADVLNLPTFDDSWAKTKEDERLSEIRLDDLRQKNIASMIATKVCRLLEESNLKFEIGLSDTEIWKQNRTPGKIYVASGFTKKYLLVHLSMFFSEKLLVRFEIEGNIYKRGVIINKNDLDKKKNVKVEDGFNFRNFIPNELCKLFSENKCLDPDIKYPVALDGKCGLITKNYGIYNMKHYMVYQSRIVPDSSTILDVAQAMVDEIIKIKNVISAQ